MTIQQLQYVLEISRTGSVSKAARNLYLSQPNISNAIKNLESELNITIFERTPMGMQLTPIGKKLVKKAAVIMEDIRDITAVNYEDTGACFRFVYPRYVPAYEAFCELCRRYEDRPYIQLDCYIGDGEKQAEALHQDRCDLVVFFDDESPSMRRLCAELQIGYVPLVETSYQIQVSENHPILQGEFDINRLKDFPYVAFADLNDWNGSWLPWEDIINPNKLICVQSTSSRVSLVSRTNAFSIVLPHSEEYNREHHVVQIPFKNTRITVGYLYSLDRGLSDISREYVEILKEKLDFLNK